ncbi:hypothetical protein [Amycolatopsis methanolica]|nr:hypothetical protein [Amycolatopsis methanolica]
MPTTNRGGRTRTRWNRMLTNIMYVTVYVTDQDRALEFYTE